MIKSGLGPQSNRKDYMVLIQVRLTRANKEVKETIWARPVGDDLYEIKGPLHLIAGLNSQDLVKAVKLPGDSFPSVDRIINRSGYKTLHVLFLDAVSTSDQPRLLGVLRDWGAAPEKAFDRFYTIQVKPAGNYQAVCDYLKSLSNERLLLFEPEVTIDTLLRLRFVSGT